MLSCLREVYGQRSQPGADNHDLVEMKRAYLVDTRRQIRLYQCWETIRILEDNVDHIEFYEPEHSEAGVASTDFRVTAHPEGGHVTYAGATKSPRFPDGRHLRLDFDRRFQTGDVISFGWEEAVTFGPAVTHWTQYFVTTLATNDNYTLDMTVTFEGELPALVWSFEASAHADPHGIEPTADRILIPDENATYMAHGDSCERRLDYGIIWRWSDWESSSDA